MEPSTRTLKAKNYSFNSETKYITSHFESYYFLESNSRDELVAEIDPKLIPEPEHDLDFVSDSLKYIFKVDEAFYHFFMDSLPVILKLSKEYPERLLLLYVHSPTRNVLCRQIYDFLKVVLDGEGVNYQLIEMLELYEYHKVVRINNFAIVEPYFDDTVATTFIDVLYATDIAVKYAKKELGLDGGTSEANKKVFITGEPVTQFEFPLEDVVDLNGYQNDKRMYNREKLESFFSDQGYEIVDPSRDFETLAEQILYMSQASVLAAVTCSGLANMIFMNPNQKVLEIQAQIVQNIYDPAQLTAYVPMQGVHTMYSLLTYMKGHLLFSLPSHRDPDDVIQRLKSSGLLEII